MQICFILYPHSYIGKTIASDGLSGKSAYEIWLTRLYAQNVYYIEVSKLLWSPK